MVGVNELCVCVCTRLWCVCVLCVGVGACVFARTHVCVCI